MIEIWNLVFIQFNRGPDKKLTPLPAKHVDTGMGFERVTAVLQGKNSNYDTDVFTPIFAAIQRVTGAPAYTGKLNDFKDIAYRVIADHVRMVTFAITDGALPGNKERGAVLRSVLRRAFASATSASASGSRSYGGSSPPWSLHMGNVYPELRSNPERVQDIIRGEEGEFLRTIDRGMERFGIATAEAIGASYARKNGLEFVRWTGRGLWEGDDPSLPLGIDLRFKNSAGQTLEKSLPMGQVALTNFIATETDGSFQITAKHVFDLHTTYGFPVDLTRQMAVERGYFLDEEGYHLLMKEHEEKSRAREAPLRSPSTSAAASYRKPKTRQSTMVCPLRARSSAG